MSGQILASGGAALGGPFDDLVLELGGSRVCFVPTASSDPEARLVSFYESFAPRAEATHVLFNPWPRRDLREHVLAQDVIYIAGGSTANMLAIWRVHGFDSLLREAWERGALLCGSSAGMICWFESGVTDSFGPELAPLHDLLGFLPGSACPHYDGEERRRPLYRSSSTTASFPRGMRLTMTPRFTSSARTCATRSACVKGRRVSRRARVRGPARDARPALKRVVVLSTASGNGKTTVGRALAEKLGIPFHELDALHHGPNWTEATAEELRAKVEPIVATDAWVVDGAYRGKLGDLVLEPADIVVWLDLPIRVWLPRLLRRTVRRVIRKEELWNGNRERLRDVLYPPHSVVYFALRHHRERRARYPSELSRFRVVRLRSQDEVDDFVKTAVRET